MSDNFQEMESEALKTLLTEGMSKDKVEFIRSLDMGYEFQPHYLETPVPGGVLNDESKKMIIETFESLHEKRYGHRIEAPLITANIRLKAIGKIRHVPLNEIKQGKEIPAEAVKTARKVFLEDNFVEARIFEREHLLCGNVIEGPAIVEEPYHTTMVMPGQTLEVDKFGNLVILIGGK